MGIDSRLPLPTAAGWLPIGHLSPGDEVFTFDGNLTKVVTIQKYTPAKCYKIWFQGGFTLVVDGRTGIPVFDYQAYGALRRWTRTQDRKRPVVRPVSPDAIMNYTFGRSKLPVCQPLKPRHRNLPVDPYEFGRWIMEKSLKRKRNRTDITRELIERYPTIPDLIPEEYLLASFEQRLALLRGIVSAHVMPYKPKKRSFELRSNDIRLIRQMQNLVESMGVQSFIGREQKKNRYILYFKTIIRLVEEQEEPKNLRPLEFRKVEKVEEVAPREGVYVKTEDPNNTILIGEGYLGVSL